VFSTLWLARTRPGAGRDENFASRGSANLYTPDPRARSRDLCNRCGPQSPAAAIRVNRIPRLHSDLIRSALEM
jgi:hypothetical protein